MKRQLSPNGKPAVNGHSHKSAIAINGHGKAHHGDGKPLEHTPQLISQLFDEELEKILAALPAETPEEAKEKYRQARRISEAMITQGEFDPI